MYESTNIIIFAPLEAEDESLDLVSGPIIVQRTARPTFEIRNRNLRAKYRPIQAAVLCEASVCKNQLEICWKQIFCRTQFEQEYLMRGAA